MARGRHPRAPAIAGGRRVAEAMKRSPMLTRVAPAHIVREIRGVIESLSQGRHHGEFYNEVADLEHAIAMLEGMSDNPPLATFSNPPTVISEEVTRIEYRHVADGKAYFHNFRPPVRMRAINARTVELFHPTRNIVVDV